MGPRGAVLPIFYFGNRKPVLSQLYQQSYLADDSNSLVLVKGPYLLWDDRHVYLGPRNLPSPGTGLYSGERYVGCMETGDPGYGWFQSFVTGSVFQHGEPCHGLSYLSGLFLHSSEFYCLALLENVITLPIVKSENLLLSACKFWLSAVAEFACLWF